MLTKHISLPILMIFIFLFCNCQDSKNSVKISLNNDLCQAAIMMINNDAMRKSFLMDRVGPISYPNQIKNAYKLSRIELAALCLFMRDIHIAKFKNLIGPNSKMLFGYNLNPSIDYWESIDLNIADMNEALKLKTILISYLYKINKNLFVEEFVSINDPYTTGYSNKLPIKNDSSISTK